MLSMELPFWLFPEEFSRFAIKACVSLELVEAVDVVEPELLSCEPVLEDVELELVELSELLAAA
jgi:hypothetical protein